MTDFSPDYVRLVLSENFEDAKALLLRPLLAIEYAHLVMLAARGILPAEDARALRSALDAIDPALVARVPYNPAFEDLFYYIGHLVAETAGADRAGSLHTARSRNDIDMTMYRMRLREDLLALSSALLDLRRAVLTLAEQHTGSLFAAHTHGQPAQPTSLAHYLLAAAEQFERDERRLAAAYETVNRCPLGACAITGTGFPIDRDLTSSLLGFEGPTGNTYGSIAAVDYALESAAAAGVLLIGLGRVVQDLLLWSTREMGYLRLSDAFVQRSSIMPQKRNPVALEHARALGSKAAAELAAVPLVVHNTPFGDIVDTEDDLQPLVARGFRDAGRAVALVAAALGGATFDVARMTARAGAEWVTATELADTLAREHGVPFGRAHAIAAELAQHGSGGSSAALAEALGAIFRRHGLDLQWPASVLTRLLSPEHFVGVRRTPGGPAPDVVGSAIADRMNRVEGDAGRVEAARAALDAADRRRRAAVDAL